VICSAFDVDGDELNGIVIDSWNDLDNGIAKVYYFSKRNLNYQYIKNVVTECSVDYVFVNGIYSFYFNILPLIYCKARKVVSVRGMLHPEALLQKRFKKKVFLALLTPFLRNKVMFHATDVQEAVYVKNIFGKGAKVTVVKNFPNCLDFCSSHIKIENRLRLISIGIISPMKNYKLVFKALEHLPANVEIEYDIYGPVKDNQYWQQCKNIMSQIPENVLVKYKGAVKPVRVPELLKAYDAFILPSKSENFGHSLYEALSSGMPIITSLNTPWNNLKVNKAGLNVNPENILELTAAIQYMSDLNPTEYEEWQHGARQYAEKVIDIEKIKSEYKQLFR
jgi:glycosyltransferase involved in cell wall biosynthesis